GEIERARVVAELPRRKRGVRRRRRISRHARSASRVEPLLRRDVGGLRVLRARECVLIARDAEIAEVEVAGELREKVLRARDLLLHLLDLEVAGDARLLGGEWKCEKKHK